MKSSLIDTFWRRQGMASLASFPHHQMLRCLIASDSCSSSGRSSPLFTDSGVRDDFSTGGLEATSSSSRCSSSGREGFCWRDERQTTDHRLWRYQFQEVCLGPSSKACNVNQTINGFNMAAPAPSDSNGANVEHKRFPIKFSIRTLAVATCFGGVYGLIRVLLPTLPPDFVDRWRSLFKDTAEAEVPRTGGSEIPTVFYDRNGIVIATIASEGYGYQRDAELPGGSGKPKGFTAGDIPSWMWQAVVASEDRGFFKHQGIDPRGLSRAIFSLSSSGGGSTITQQLVKNVFLNHDRKWTRKLVELILAFVLEKQMSKWDILHLYLKKIYWGHGVYGINGASALYFGKHPSLLTLGECAMLAGIIPAPEMLSPFRDPSRGKRPQGRTLRRMVEAGFLDTATAAEVMKEPLRFGIESDEGTSGPWKAPFFVSEVLYELVQKYGWAEVTCGGLRVHTTLDLSMQSIAEKVVQDAAEDFDDERVLLSEKGLRKTQAGLEALQSERQEKLTRVVEAVIKSLEEEKHVGKPETVEEESDATISRTRGEIDRVAESSFARKAAARVVKRFVVAEEYLEATVAKYQAEVKIAEQSRVEGSMVAIDPTSGAVRVLVGGRDYYESSFNRGTQAFRSPGSTFKPVVYLAALADGFKCDHVLVDEPFTIGDFTPENYDQRFRGQVTLEQALLYSLNVPTVRLCAEVGVDKVCEMGRALGIDTFLPHELQLSLGGCEVTPMQLAAVYATIAAGGFYHKPHLITRVETHNGKILEEHKPFVSRQQRCSINESAVAELCRLLQAVVSKGTGRSARLGRPCGGKTGTSNEHRDIWFAGFTPEISCVVWLGYDDNSPLGGIHSATGASHAAPIWKKFMKIVHEGTPVRKFRDSRGFTKRSRRPTRIGLHKIRRTQQKRKDNNLPWKQVWDWEKASIAWAEQEKMEEWIAVRAKRVAEVPRWVGRLRPILAGRGSKRSLHDRNQSEGERFASRRV